MADLIKLKINGVREFEDRLDVLDGKLRHQTDFFKDAGDYLHDQYERVFDAEGPGWAPWSQSYAAWRSGSAFGNRVRSGEVSNGLTFSGGRARPAGGGTQILTLTGALRHDMTKGYLRRPSNVGVTLGTTLRYASWVKNGTSHIASKDWPRQKRGWPRSGRVVTAHMPARDFTKLPWYVFPELRRMRQRWLRDNVREAGL